MIEPVGLRRAIVKAAFATWCRKADGEPASLMLARIRAERAAKARPRGADADEGGHQPTIGASV